MPVLVDREVLWWRIQHDPAGTNRRDRTQHDNLELIAAYMPPNKTPKRWTQPSGEAQLGNHVTKHNYTTKCRNTTGQPSD